MNRKHFLLQSTTAGAAMLMNPLQSLARTQQDREPYKLDIVKEFVIVGHGRLDRVKEMLEEYPNLLFCRYDWVMVISKKLSKAPAMWAIRKLLAI
jgi:hypothetical protein